MLQEWSGRLRERLFKVTRWNRSRCECLANIVCATIASRSVKLDDLAAHVPGSAKFSSKTRRLQSFFLDFDFDYYVVGLLLVAILGPLLPERWLLAIDRTNWTRRGNQVNLLTLAVCLGDVAIPLVWTDLGHKGNSNTAQRIELLERFIAVFGQERILVVTADREFVGGEWFRWLKDRRIPFILRVKDNFQVMTKGGYTTDICNCFRNLPLCKQRVLGMRKVCGVTLEVSGLRLPNQEYVIVVSGGIEAERALLAYRDRWQIETLFEKLKGHGFDFEGSRLRGEGKAEKLMAILAIATAWCYSLGQWHVNTIEPLAIKTHGRRAKAIFRRGLDILRQILNGCAAQLARFSRIALGLLPSSAHEQGLNLC